MKISIIMPAYNSADYISTAIENIKNQTYRNFELIIVDDGSIDETGTLCEEYSKKDSRILLFHQQNKGVCSARNLGLAKATGDYITFCDNDDSFEKNLLKDNIELAIRYDADIVRWNFTTYIDNNRGKVRDYKNRIILCNKDIARFYSEIRQTNDAVWNGMYKRDFLSDHNIIFNEFMKYGGEDLNFSLQLLHHSPKIVLNSESYYNWYLRNDHSTSGRRCINFCDSMLLNATYEFDLMKKLGIHDTDYLNSVRTEYYNYILQYARDISIWQGLRYKKIMKKEKWYKN